MSQPQAWLGTWRCVHLRLCISFCFRVIKIFLHTWVVLLTLINVSVSRPSPLVSHNDYLEIASRLHLKTFFRFLVWFRFVRWRCHVMFHSSLNSFIYIFGLCFNIRIDFFGWITISLVWLVLSGGGCCWLEGRYKPSGWLE